MKKPLEIRRDVPTHWVGDGLPVQSLMSYHADSAAIDPFLLLDYLAPHHFEPSPEQLGVGEHPHRGFETVTLVYQGELAHRDSAGHAGTIGPGDVQWMTAAAGIVHEEFHSEAFRQSGGTLEMVQLWVNLPASEKMSPPRYQGIASAQIPQVQLPVGVGSVRVIAGEYAGMGGPAQTASPVTVWDLQLNAGGSVELPLADGHTAIALVRRGEIQFPDDRSALAGELAIFSRAGAGLALRAVRTSEALVLSGAPLGEPIVGQGPFVMNNAAQIRQAIDDYRAGRMGRLS